MNIQDSHTAEGVAIPKGAGGQTLYTVALKIITSYVFLSLYISRERMSSCHPKLMGEYFFKIFINKV